MSNKKILESLNGLTKDVKEIKTIQKRTLLYLEDQEKKAQVIPINSEERISVKETCSLLNCSTVTLWKIRRDGIIPFTKHKRTIRFKKVDVLNYLNQIK